MGTIRRIAPASRFFRFLERFREIMVIFVFAFEKIFKNDKNFVCIWTKMGYNEVVYSPV